MSCFRSTFRTSRILGSTRSITIFNLQLGDEAISKKKIEMRAVVRVVQSVIDWKCLVLLSFLIREKE